MLELKDQLDRSLSLAAPARRIVSLVPSLTELAADLAGTEALVGITVWCVHPSGLKEEKTVIGGTKDINLNKIRALKPDLILANREENLPEQVEPLMDEYPVYVSEVKNVADCLDLILDLGILLGTKEKAAQIIASAERHRKHLKKDSRRFLYFIWKEPYMVAGPDTYISNLLEEIGYENLAPSGSNRYPSLSEQEIKDLKPELVLLSSEPYAFTTEDSLSFYRLGFKTKLVDGELLSWYGSRLVKSLLYLQKLVRN